VSQAVEEINKAYPDSQEAKEIISFVENSNRGIV
jgi:acyl-[acyl carrier protein]--UDP-N-acetylglucosamine O-acyltransferase